MESDNLPPMPIISKGGVNSKPVGNRPPPPSAQRPTIKNNAPNPTSDTTKDFEEAFPYATTFIDFQNALIDYSLQCRLPKTTEKNKKAEIAAQVKVLKMYNHLLTLLQENNISPNDYYG